MILSNSAEWVWSAPTIAIPTGSAKYFFTALHVARRTRRTNIRYAFRKIKKYIDDGYIWFAIKNNTIE